MTSDPEPGRGARALTAYAHWVVRHRLAVLLAVLGITALLGSALGRLRVEVDPDRQLPQEHPYIEALNEVHRVFGDKSLVVIALFPNGDDVFTPAFLAKLADITNRLGRIPGANPALLLSLASPPVKVIQGTADGLDVRRVMETPPTTQADADAVRARAFAGDQYIGTLVARNGRAAAIQASFELTPTIPGYRQLHAAVAAALAEADDGTFTYQLAGPVVFLSQVSAYSGRMAFYFPIALVVIGLIHYDAFRTLQALFLPLLTALLSVLWGLGLMGALGVPLDPFNTTTPILILAVAAGHAVQILKRFYEEYDRLGDVHAAVVASLERVGPVMMAAGLVAALSFWSLTTFGTASIRTFGLFTGFGILSAMVVEMTIIPAVRAMLPAPPNRERERQRQAHPLFDRFLRLAARSATGAANARVLIGALALIAACGVLATRIEVDTSIKREFSPNDPVRRADAAINGSFAGTNTLIALVDHPDNGALEEPAVMRAIATLETRLQAEPDVGKALSYVDFVRTMHHALNADRPDAGDLPATRALTAQYLFLYSLSGGSNDLDTWLDPTHRLAKVRFLVHDDSTHRGLQLISLARDTMERELPPGYRVRFTGTLASTAATTEVMVHGKLRNIIQIAAITVAVAALLLQSLVGGLLVALPLAIAVAVNFGVMGLLGIPLDTMTAAISAMAVGIGADYALYFLARVREEVAGCGDLAVAVDRTLATSGKAILFVASAIGLGYSTLCLSGFALHVQLGALVALAMLVSAGAALLLLPAIVVRFRPRFVIGPGPSPTSHSSDRSMAA